MKIVFKIKFIAYSWIEIKYCWVDAIIEKEAGISGIVGIRMQSVANALNRHSVKSVIIF